MASKRVPGGQDRARHGTLYYGDNLDVLRQYVPDESVDLVYLDPPFQSGKNYNIIVESREGAKAAAQIQAFEDTWKWGLGPRPHTARSSSGAARSLSPCGHSGNFSARATSRPNCA
ncbi:hypothetical protein [Polyangium mundeleinium]|uniref:DNA methylase N-4/N-6 domain-containing protein n=1 Tax=Polyangium mundeleinium TaxID=2995306 RepID=A0ABT5F7D8_9BACT|nr:hypothetical protein [Polyangium mundeleinium]MDC0750000.1 hypothetical protein [Polyangium mundeleinium]